MDRIQQQIVLSASRRTDIPAFYMPWFMEGIRRGEFSVRNPYSARTTIVPADVASVHSIVFWSKDFGPFLSAGYGEQLSAMGYHLFFNFTVNTPDPLLEPGVPPLRDRLAQMAELTRRFPPAAIQWRFDPVVCYQRPGEGVVDNLWAFEEIAHAAASCGVGRCITSFMDHYPKTRRRWRDLPGGAFVDPSVDDKIDMLRWMAGILVKHGIPLTACCEKSLLDALPEDVPVGPAACIPSDLLMGIYGGRVSLAADQGQRRRFGCQCRISRDIGSYADHPCAHNCRFCYANPVQA